MSRIGAKAQRNALRKEAKASKFEKAYARAWVEALRWSQYVNAAPPHHNTAPVLAWGFIAFCLAAVCLGMLSEIRGCS